MKELLDEGNIEPRVTRLREIAVAHAGGPAGLAQVCGGSTLGRPSRRYSERRFAVGSGCSDFAIRHTIASSTFVASGQLPIPLCILALSVPQECVLPAFLNVIPWIPPIGPNAVVSRNRVDGVLRVFSIALECSRGRPS